MVIELLRVGYPANGPWAITLEDMTLALFPHGVLWQCSSPALRRLKHILARKQCETHERVAGAGESRIKEMCKHCQGV